MKVSNCLELTIALLLIAVFEGCNQQERNMKTSNFQLQNSKFQLPAIYTGTIPCASCPGIDYQIILDNERFTEISIYQDRSAGEFKNTGTWKISSDTLILSDNTDSIIKRFLVRDDSLVLLKKDKQQISGPMSHFYILEREGELESIYQRHQNLAAQGYKYFAAGNEPFWSFRIVSLNHAVFETPESHIEFEQFELPASSKNIDIDLKQKNVRLTTSIREDICRDSMSGYLFPQTVEVILQTTRPNTFKGCGIFLNR